MIRLNSGQRLALNLDAHIAVDAGAGTGKTNTIVERVIQHYLHEGRGLQKYFQCRRGLEEYHSVE